MTTAERMMKSKVFKTVHSIFHYIEGTNTREENKWRQ